MNRRNLLKGFAGLGLFLPTIAPAKQKKTASYKKNENITISTVRGKPVIVRWFGSTDYDFVHPEPVDYIKVKASIVEFTGPIKHQYIRFICDEPDNNLAFSFREGKMGMWVGPIIGKDDMLCTGIHSTWGGVVS